MPQYCLINLNFIVLSSRTFTYCGNLGHVHLHILIHNIICRTKPCSPNISFTTTPIMHNWNVNCHFLAIPIIAVLHLHFDTVEINCYWNLRVDGGSSFLVEYKMSSLVKLKYGFWWQFVHCKTSWLWAKADEIFIVETQCSATSASALRYSILLSYDLVFSFDSSLC